MFARRSFWCIAETMRSAGLVSRPYHVYVPSFGEWGFVLAGGEGWTPPRAYPPGLRFLTVDATPALFAFPPDMAAVPVEVNRLDNQILVQYYGAEWQRIFPAACRDGGPRNGPPYPPDVRSAPAEP